MQIEEIEVKGLNHKYKITVSNQQISKEIESKLQKIAKTAKIPGFRPGKVPPSFIKQKYEDAVHHEIVEDFIHKGTHKVFHDHKIRQADKPKIDLKDYNPGKDLEYTLEVEVLPNIDVKDHSKLSLIKLTPQASDQEVQDALDTLVKDHVRHKAPSKDRASGKKDLVHFKLTLSKDGKPESRFNNMNLSAVLGEEFFIPAIEPFLHAKKKGEIINDQVTLDKDFFISELSGQTFDAQIEITEILEEKKFKADDELAKDLGLENLADLKEKLKEQVVQSSNHMCRLYMKRKLLDQLAELYDFSLPQSMVEKEYNQIWSQLKKEIEQAKSRNELSEDESNPDDDEALKTEYRALAERRVRLGLLISKISEDNNIQLTEQEARNRLVEEATRYPGQESQVIDFYIKNPKMFEPIAKGIIEEKVIEFLMGQIKLTEKNVSAKEIEDLMKEIFPDDGEESKSKSAKSTTPSKAKKSAKSKKDEEA